MSVSWDMGSRVWAFMVVHYNNETAEYKSG